MQFATYFFASILSFLGLLIGIILVKIAPEEQRPLLKYFGIMRRIILFLIFIFLIFYFYSNVFYLSMLISYLIFAAIIELRIHDLKRRFMLIYLILGILFYLSKGNTGLFAIESALILLHGLPTASLTHYSKDEFKALYSNAGFLLMANILFLMQYL